MVRAAAKEGEFGRGARFSSGSFRARNYETASLPHTHTLSLFTSLFSANSSQFSVSSSRPCNCDRDCGFKRIENKMVGLKRGSKGNEQATTSNLNAKYCFNKNNGFFPLQCEREH